MSKSYKYMVLLSVMGVFYSTSAFSGEESAKSGSEGIPLSSSEILKSKIEEVLDENRRIKKAKILYPTRGELIDKKNELKEQARQLEEEIQQEEKNYCKYQIDYLTDELIHKSNIEAILDLVGFFEELGAKLIDHVDQTKVIELYNKALTILNSQPKESPGSTSIAELNKAFSTLDITLSKEQTNPHQSKIESLGKALDDGKVEAINELISFYKEVGPKLKDYISEEDIQELHDKAGTLLSRERSSRFAGAKMQELRQVPSDADFHKAIQQVLN